MSDTCALTCTTEPPICYETNLQPHSCDDCRRIEHFLHTGTALRSLVTDDNHIAIVNLPLHDGVDTVFLGVKAPCRTTIRKHIVCNRRCLDNGAIRRKVSAQDGKTTLGAIWMLDTMDYRWIQNLCVCDALPHRSCNGQCIQMQQIHLRQFLHHRRNAARLIQILHVVRSCGTQLRNIRRTSTDLIKQRRWKLNSRLMCNRREMQNSIRRTSDAHIDRDRIFKCLTRHNVARADIIFNKVKDDCTRMLCQQATLSCVGRRNCSVAGETHAEHLGQRIHRVRCKQTGAGTAAGAGMFLNSSHLTGIHLAGSKHPGCLECLTDTDVTSAMASGKHGAAADENCRNVEACRRH